MLLRTVTILVLAAAFILPVPVHATSVQPGIDPVRHIPPSQWDFGPVPLPADFFEPGSDPFDGGIPGDQTALPPVPECPGDLGPTSMLIQRKDVALLPTMPSSDVIDVEIIALSLLSSSPITVTYNGGLNPEQWDVEITLSSSLASTGTMTIRKEHANGGTFDAAIFVQPHFTFTRVADGQVLTLDGAGTYEDEIYHSLYETEHFIIFVALGALLLVFFLVFTLSKVLTRPVQELTEITTRMVGGDLSQRAHIHGADEIGILGVSFNRMISQIQNYTSNLEKMVEARTGELKESREKYRDISRFLNNVLDSATMYAIMALDFYGNIIEFNRGAEKLFGWKKEDVLNNKK